MIEAFMEEIKPKVIEKKEFEYRDVYKLIAFFAVFEYHDSHRKNIKQNFSFDSPHVKSLRLTLRCKKASW